MDEFSSQIGIRIKELRIKKKLKQKDFLKLLGSGTIQMVSGWENGNTTPSPFYLIKISKILDTSLDYLMTGKTNDGVINPILTYGDAAKCILSLTDSGLFKTTLHTDFGNNVLMSSCDQDIFSFMTDYNKLKNVSDVLGASVFEQQVKLLMLKYDISKIAKEENEW